MLKRDVTYTTFDGETVTETFYFNLTKTEIVELQVSVDGGLQEMLQRIVDNQDIKAIMGEFKKIILLTYGERSDDGKRFIKSDDIREKFSQTAAFDELFMDLATNDESASNFIKGVIPTSMLADLNAVTTPPLPPAPPSN